MNWVEELFKIMTGGFTKDKLRQAGAGDDAISGAITTAVDLPTGYNAAHEENNIRTNIVQFCRSELGKPYKLGIEILPGREADSPATDCSELVEMCYRMAGVTIPDGSNFQYDFCQKVHIGKAGDLHFLWSEKWSRIGHVMVDTGEGTVVHAVAGRGVVEDPLIQWTGHPRYRGVRRHPEFSRPPEDRA